MNKEDSSLQNKIPSHYFTLNKQLEILKAFTVFYENNGKGATYKQIADMLGFHRSRVSSSLKFWKHIGLLSSVHAKYTPNPPLTDFQKRIEASDSNDALRIFRSGISESWFVTETIMKLKLSHKVTKDQLIKFLANSSGIRISDNRKKVSFQILIDLLIFSRFVLVDEDGNYSINPEIGNSPQLVIDEKCDMIQVKLNGELYAIDSKMIQAFITSNGKKISPLIQNL